ncbi:MAG: DUF1638 domain-containing protein [Paracoccaceae bacterium]
MELDDSTLTREGLDPSATGGRVLLLACGALAHEILALIRANGWDHMTLQCLPAILHNHPERIAPAVREAVAAQRDRFDAIYVVYADCGTGGDLKRACDELGVEMVEGPHCYSFFEGNAAFAAHGEATSFYLTDFLVRQFDAFVWKPLGLDRHPELLEAYFGNYEKLVYLAQTDRPELDEKARDCARRLRLGYERRFTGYGDLESTLRGWAAKAP